jgi:hypothetical protein
MSGFKIQLQGLDEVLKQLDIDVIKQEVKLELEIFGQDVERDAKLNAPVDEGFLKSMIYHKATSEGNKIGMEVGCNADYAAYLEFGTRKFAAAYVATLPAVWQAFAAQYKGGRGGGFAELVRRITAWVKRKGFAAQVTKSGARSKSKNSQKQEEQAAYVIARSILINGIKPHRFLFRAVENNRGPLLDRLRKLFNA